MNPGVIRDFVRSSFPFPVSLPRYIRLTTRRLGGFWRRRNFKQYLWLSENRQETVRRDGGLPVLNSIRKTKEHEWCVAMRIYAQILEITLHNIAK